MCTYRLNRTSSEGNREVDQQAASTSAASGGGDSFEEILAIEY